jgi:Mg2+/citrate symporter
MEFILGVFVAALFFCCLFLAYWMGTRQTKQPKKVNTLTEDEQRQKEQIQRAQQDFSKMMKYDLSQALQRKKVT